MGDLRCAGELEQIAMADQVGADVGGGILDAVADAGLRAEMDDPVDLDALRAPRRARRLGKVDALETEGVAEVRAQAVEPRLA